MNMNIYSYMNMKFIYELHCPRKMGKTDLLWQEIQLLLF